MTQFSAGLTEKAKIHGSRKLQLAVLLQIRGHKVRGYQKNILSPNKSTLILPVTQSPHQKFAQSINSFSFPMVMNPLSPSRDAVPQSNGLPAQPGRECKELVLHQAIPF